MTRRRLLIGLGVALLLSLVVLSAAVFFEGAILGVEKVGAPSVEIEEPAPGAFPHGLLDALQRAYVTPAGRVDYEGLAADKRLGEYVATLAAYSPQSHPELFPDETHELTYWCNAYNAVVFWGVLSLGGGDGAQGADDDDVGHLSSVAGSFRTPTPAEAARTHPGSPRPASVRR